MKVSIITVVYNAVEGIERTIRSVASQIYKDYEYIIIDGKSTDGTLDVIEKYKNNISLLISEKDNGIYDAMNKGAKYAHGEWIVYMNAGDTFANENTLTDIFESNYNLSDADVIYGDMRSCYISAPLIIRAKPLKTLKYRMAFCHQSSYVRSDIMRQNPFNLRYKYVADFDLFNKLYIENKLFLYIPIIMTNYYPEGGLTNNHILSVMREENRISGIKDFKWLRHLIYTYISFGLNRFIPLKILNKMRFLYKNAVGI